MPRPSAKHAVAFLLLAALMAATRVHHFASIPDASWAVFFAAGFYLRTQWRWAFPALMAIANMFVNGNITAQNLTEAKNIYSALAQQDVPQAKENLEIVNNLIAEKAKTPAKK